MRAPGGVGPPSVASSNVPTSSHLQHVVAINDRHLSSQLRRERDWVQKMWPDFRLALEEFKGNLLETVDTAEGTPSGALARTSREDTIKDIVSGEMTYSVSGAMQYLFVS